MERRTVVVTALLVFVVGGAFVLGQGSSIPKPAPAITTTSTIISATTETSTLTLLTTWPTITSTSTSFVPTTLTATSTATSMLCCITTTESSTKTFSTTQTQTATTTQTITTTVTSTATTTTTSTTQQGALGVTIGSTPNPATQGSSASITVTLFNNLQMPQSVTASVQVIFAPSGNTAAITLPSQTSESVTVQPNSSFPWVFGITIASNAPLGQYQIQVQASSPYGNPTAIVNLSVVASTASPITVLQAVANAPDCIAGSGTSSVSALFTGSIPTGATIVALAEGGGNGISMSFSDSLGNGFITSGTQTGFPNSETISGYSTITNAGQSGDTVTATVTGAGTMQACAINIYLVSGLPSGFAVQTRSNYCNLKGCPTSVSTSAPAALNAAYFAASMCQGEGAACTISTPTVGFTTLGTANGGEYSTGGATSPTTWAITIGAVPNGWQYMGIALG